MLTATQPHKVTCSQCGGSFLCARYPGFSDCITHRNYFASNPMEVFSAAVQNGFKPTAQQMRDLMYALHEATVDLPEMLWLSINCETLADAYASAIRCHDDCQEELEANEEVTA